MAGNIAAEIGANASSYQGSAGLGGGVIDAIKIDTQPLEQLSHYAYLYNKAEADERKQKAIATAKELADASSYDLSSAIPKDRDVIKSEFDSFNQWLKDNASKIDLNKIDPISIEYRARKTKFTSLLSGAKGRTIMYKSRQADIASKDPVVAAELQRQLDQEASSSDIYTPLQPSQEYDLAPVEVKPSSMISVDVVRKGDNQIVKRDYSIPSFQDARSQAIAIVGGLIDRFPKVGTPEYENLPQSVKNGIEEQRKVQIYSGKLQPVKDAETISAVINKTDSTGKKVYFDADGNLDVNALMKGESGNGLFTRVMQQVDAYNNNINNIKSAISNGEFQDKTGKKLAFGFGLDEADFQPIDLGKGSITPEELLTMKIIGKTQDVSYKTTIQETGEAIANAKNATDRAQLGETTRHNKATEAIERQNATIRQEALDANKDKWKSTQTGGETVKNGAMLRAQRIYDSLKKLTDANGVISPDKVRQLNNEQLKYLGGEKLIQDEADPSKTKNVYSPLNLSGDKKEYAIQLVDGEIKVLQSKEDKIDKAANGAYLGLWDNTKSTNIFNVATNILNEELRTAGSKELNSYMPLDAGGNPVETDNFGGGSGASGGSSSTASQSSGSSQLSTDPNDWKKVGKYYQYKDGSLYDDNLKKVK